MRISRFLGMGGVALLCASSLVAWVTNRHSKPNFNRYLFSSESPFLDPLPIPPRMVIGPGQREITIHLNEFQSTLYGGVSGPSKMWGYNGTSPGPTIEVESGQPLTIHWKNDLPKTHVFPAPAAMVMKGVSPGDRVEYHGAIDPNPNTAKGKDLPEVRNITHLHGALVSETNPLDRLKNNDGWPDAWNLPGDEQIAEYPNHQDARTLWYHDHAFGQTGRNVQAGLAGLYIIHDRRERRLNLPSGKYEIPLIFQSMGIQPDGTRYYTDMISTEAFGNSVAINGKILPYLEVEPRKYRFRMLNASTARMYGLKLVDAENQTVGGPAFYQIASDSGFLEKPVILNDPTNPDSKKLFLASAERADVIIDFSAFAGKTLHLYNSESITDTDGEIPVPILMQLRVAKNATGPDSSVIPTQIRKIKRLSEKASATTRPIILTQTDYPDGLSIFRLNKRSWVYPKTDARGDFWDYAIDTKAVAGTTEVWELINTSPMIHPFHIHPVQFQVLDRRPFDVDHYNDTGQVVYTGPALAPEPNEMGWKDVIRANPRQITRIIMHFDSPTGYYVYHCHILEHEDMDMMVPYQVVAPAP